MIPGSEDFVVSADGATEKNRDRGDSALSKASGGDAAMAEVKLELRELRQAVLSLTKQVANLAAAGQTPSVPPSTAAA